MIVISLIFPFQSGIFLVGWLLNHGGGGGGEDKLTSTSLYPIHWFLNYMSFGADTHYVKKPKKVGGLAHSPPVPTDKMSIFAEAQGSKPHSTHTINFQSF